MVAPPETIRLNPTRNGGYDTTAINPHCRGRSLENCKPCSSEPEERHLRCDVRALRPARGHYAIRFRNHMCEHRCEGRQRAARAA
jgi:hypothetical protein